MTGETCIISSHTTQRLPFWGKPKQSKPQQVSPEDFKESFSNVKD